MIPSERGLRNPGWSSIAGFSPRSPGPPHMRPPCPEDVSVCSQSAWLNHRKEESLHLSDSPLPAMQTDCLSLIGTRSHMCTGVPVWFTLSFDLSCPAYSMRTQSWVNQRVDLEGSCDRADPPSPMHAMCGPAGRACVAYARLLVPMVSMRVLCDRPGRYQAKHGSKTRVADLCVHHPLPWSRSRGHHQLCAHNWAVERCSLAGVRFGPL